MKNKKGYFGISLVGFFFALMVVTAILFFFLTALPVILHTYGIEQAVSINENLVTQGVSSATSQNNIIALADRYKTIYLIADYMFIFFIVSAFIQSIISATRAKREGIFSFFGLITLGNVMLVFLLTLAVRISDWILNEIVYNILLISFDTPFTNWFFEYSIFVALFWYTTLLVVNFIDFGSMLGRIGFITDSEEQAKFEE